MTLQERFQVLFELLFWLCVGVAIIGALVWLGFKVAPALNDLWIKTFRSTNEYVSTKEKLLYQLKGEYEKAEIKILEAGDNQAYVNGLRAQQQSLLDRIEVELSLLQESQRPTIIVEFLKEHKRQ